MRGRGERGAGPIQHEAKPSAVLRARDHDLRVFYSAGTACTKRALTNLLYFERGQVRGSAQPTASIAS